MAKLGENLVEKAHFIFKTTGLAGQFGQMESALNRAFTVFLVMKNASFCVTLIRSPVRQDSCTSEWLGRRDPITMSTPTSHIDDSVPKKKERFRWHSQPSCLKERLSFFAQNLACKSSLSTSYTLLFTLSYVTLSIKFDSFNCDQSKIYRTYLFQSINLFNLYFALQLSLITCRWYMYYY